MLFYDKYEYLLDLAIRKRVNFSWFIEVIDDRKKLSIEDQLEMYNKIVSEKEKLTIKEFALLKHFIRQEKKDA